MSRSDTLRTGARTALYAAYYRLPRRLQRWLVRRATPTYTVGAVILVRDSGAGPDGPRLLLLTQPPRRGWSLPAGLLARGESPLDGAVRELAEETGIRLRPDQLRAAVPNAVVHHRGRWVDMVFEAAVPADETPLQVDGAEVFAAAWHPLDALPPLTNPTARLLGCYRIGPYAEHDPAELA